MSTIIDGTNGVTFPSGTVQGDAAAGFGQTLQDVTASRAAGTTYTNTTGKPIFVSATYTGSANTAPTMTIGAVTFSGSYAAAGNQMQISSMIPVGATYSVGVLGGTVSTMVKWVEVR